MSESAISKFGQIFISYGSYHYNIVNKWIHIICVPLILATLLSSLSFAPISFEVAGLNIGLAQILVATMLVYYSSINISFTLGMAILLASASYGWKKIFDGMESDSFVKWLIVIHIVAWVFQFVGHGVFEKRKPALLDNITQIYNAPLFVVVQIFEMLGIRSAEMQVWNAQIKKNVEQFRAKDKAK